MRRMLVVAATTCLLGVAGAEEPRKAAQGEPGAPAKAAEAKEKDGGAKAGEPKAAPAPKADAGPEKQKPCEPIKPCPIE